MLTPFINKAENKTYVIFSPMEGMLTADGKPLANIKITRELSWNANEAGVIEHFYTDDKGYFKLPLREESFKMSNLTQFVANQFLTVDINGQEDEIWTCGKLSEDLFGETGNELKSLVCDLSNQASRVAGDVRGVLVTKCRWDNIELETYDE